MSRNSRGEENWVKLVLIATLILAVIAFFKFLFWISLAIAGIGILWALIVLLNREDDYSWSPVLIVVGILVAFISYQIGYGFEQTALGGSIVNASKTIVNADQTIEGAKENATQGIIYAVTNVTGENK